MTGEPTEPAPDGLSDAQYRAMYEGFYARAGDDFSAVPWAALRPHPALVGWLDPRPAATDARALVVGCGLGDDAEYVATHGFATTAFDFSGTAISRCRERFPASPVDYRVADLLALPENWTAAFDLVVEIRTLQSMPADRRPAAVPAIAATVRQGGVLLVHTFTAGDGERFDGPPWPVTPTQLAWFADAGLEQLERSEDPTSPLARSLTAIYQRPAEG